MNSAYLLYKLLTMHHLLPSTPPHSIIIMKLWGREGWYDYLLLIDWEAEAREVRRLSWGYTLGWWRRADIEACTALRVRHARTHTHRHGLPTSLILTHDLHSFQQKPHWFVLIVRGFGRICDQKGGHGHKRLDSRWAHVTDNEHCILREF